MASISNVTARQILDSRGVPTVEVTVELNNGVTATSSAPSGSIANEIEAQELRDHNTSEYFGQGVQKAVENVNTAIRQELIGKDPLYQTQIDQTLVNLDGTTNKSKLGANAILATSQAVMKAAAASLKLPVFVYVKEKYQLIQSYRVPTPIFNLLNGGQHGSGTLDFQEFQLVPASHLSYSKALQIGVEMFMALDKVLEQKGAIRTVGVEGGYSPNLATNTDALEIFSEAIKLTSYALAKDAFLGLDVAPKNFYRNGKYTIKDRPQPMKARELVQFYKDLHHQYRVFSFEDPLAADAWSDWKFITAEMGGTAMIVADDLITTNKTLLMKAIQENACNAVVIKPNRVGTVTETIEITHLARQNGWHTIMSHRSGETTDDFMADLAVGIGTEYVKFGAPSRGERVVKYNRLLRIEEILLRSRKPNESTEENNMNMNDNGNVNPLGGSDDTNANSAPAAATPVPATNPQSAPAAPTSPAPAPAPMTPTPTPTPTQPSAPTPSAMAPTPTPAPTGDAPAASTAPAVTGDQPNPLVSSAAPEPSALPNQEAVPANSTDVNDLQNSINELANMAATSPTPGQAAPAPTQAPAPASPAPAPMAPTPTPTPTQPSTPAPAGLTPPTPPQE